MGKHIKRCSHCLEEVDRFTIESGVVVRLCEICTKLPKCEGCESVLNNPSEDNPNRCDECVEYEEGINVNCGVCGKKIDQTRKYYLTFGNFCKSCLITINNNIGNRNNPDYKYVWIKDRIVEK